METILEFIKIFVMSVVQGVTEWLPISSTGHMIIVDKFLKLQQSGAFIETFLVLVQLGSIMAVVVLFFNKLNPFDMKTMKFKKDTLNLWVRILIATLPALIIGLAFDDMIEEIFFKPTVVALALIVYGIGFILVENNKPETKIEELLEIDYITALKIGAFQTLALIPGTSRSGATILGGLILKIKRSTIAEFSFFMAIPVMFGASLLKLIKNGLGFSGLEWAYMLFGCAVAYGVSYFAIKFLMRYIKTHDFKVFGWYRIVLGLIVLAYFYVNKSL